MAETIETLTRLWTIDGFSRDEWVHRDTPDATDRVILELEKFLALSDSERDTCIGRLGVELKPGEQLSIIAPWVDRLPLIALRFPAFGDGRSFSKAELLRTRYGFQGRIRATGEVLIDQIPMMLRTGFDEFAVSDETALRRLQSGHLGGFPHYYQPAAADQAGAAQAYSWRRSI